MKRDIEKAFTFDQKYFKRFNGNVVLRIKTGHLASIEAALFMMRMPCSFVRLVLFLIGRSLAHK